VQQRSETLRYRLVVEIGVFVGFQIDELFDLRQAARCRRDS